MGPPFIRAPTLTIWQEQDKVLILPPHMIRGPRTCLAVLCLLCLGGTVGGCSTSLGEAGSPLGAVAAAQDATRIALLLPLTADSQDLAELGQDFLDAAQMFLAESRSRHILLLPKDTQGTPEGARQAFAQAKDDGAEVILGPLLAESVRAITPHAQAAGLPVIAFSSDSTTAAKGIFLLSFPPEQDARRILAYAAQSGHKRFAAFLPRTPYGSLLRRVFLETVYAHAGDVVAIQTYPPNANAAIEPAQHLSAFATRQTHLLQAKQHLRRHLSQEPESEEDLVTIRLFPGFPPESLQESDATLSPEAPPALFESPPEPSTSPSASPSAPSSAPSSASGAEAPMNVAPPWGVTSPPQALVQLEKKESLGDVPFDALFFPEGGQLLKSIAPLLLFYDIDPQKVRFLGSGLWDEAQIGREEPLIGGWFAAPVPEARHQFERRFTGRYHYTPARLATLAYDATALVATLAQKGRLSARGLATQEGFAGLDGVVRFQDSLPQRLLAIMEIRPAKTIVREKPPDKF